MVSGAKNTYLKVKSGFKLEIKLVKLRKISDNQMIITFPKHLIKLMRLNEGDNIEFYTNDLGQWCLRKE